MIVVRLRGGLGNQLLQYATAKRLSFVNKTELYLDTRWFDNPDCVARDYGLDLFTMQPKIDNTLHDKCEHVKEKMYGFDPSILNLKGDIFLDGSWWAWRYFSDITSILKEDLTIANPYQGLSPEFIHKISSPRSVAINVRRGDFVSSNFHSVMPVEYFQSAVRLISTKINQPILFVVSDDIEWCKNNLMFEHETFFIDSYENENKAHKDMRLLTLCSNYIISNSSFGWWGAWLGNNIGKIVIAPKAPWFTGDTQANVDDRLPPKWMQIEWENI
jgi:hypothetical protein